MTRKEISARYEQALQRLAEKQAACKPCHLPKKGQGFSEWSAEYNAVLDAAAEVGHCLYLFERDDKKAATVV